MNRLETRSILTREKVRALLGLNDQIAKVAAYIDFVRLGEQVEHSCLVVDSLVGRFGQNRDGVRQITCLYIPGDMADLPSVVSPKAGWALGALTSTTILRVPHADLRRLAAKHPGIAEAFWRDCVADGSLFSEWVVNVGWRDTLSRTAHLFCEMAIRCEHAGQGNKRSCLEVGLHRNCQTIAASVLGLIKCDIGHLNGRIKRGTGIGNSR